MAISFVIFTGTLSTLTAMHANVLPELTAFPNYPGVIKILGVTSAKLIYITPVLLSNISEMSRCLSAAHRILCREDYFPLFLANRCGVEGGSWYASHASQSELA